LLDLESLAFPLDAFVRSVAINRGTPHVFFLGAGASVSSRMPSAEMCIWEWKQAIFLTRNPALQDQFRETSLVSVRDRLQRWLDSQGGQFPPPGSPEEYGLYIAACFPLPADRKRYFAEKTRAARPQSGYKLMCCLAEAGVVDSVWSTNFDGLLARAAAGFTLSPIEVGIDTQYRAVRVPHQGELLCVSLHGDYRYDPLKNTTDELQAQEAALRLALVDRFTDRPTVVVGYSGRDESIMAALHEAFGTPGPGSLFWCGYGEAIPSSVERLIRTARAAGRTACYVATQGFDDFISRLAQHVLYGQALERANEIIADKSRGSEFPTADFLISEQPIGGVIKSNAFSVRCPPELYQFTATRMPERGVWEWLRQILGDRELLAAPFKRKVLALGTLSDIEAAFGDQIEGPVERAPIGEEDLRIEDGVVVSLLRSALVRSAAASRQLDTDKERLLWFTDARERREFNRQTYAVHEAALIFLRRIGGESFVVVKPTLRIVGPGGEEAPEEAIRDLKARILGWQHNDKFNEAVDRWRSTLFPDSPTHFEYPVDCGSTFRFEVRHAPVFAQIAVADGERAAQLPPKVHTILRQRGFRVGEPPLVFANARGAGQTRDGHPVRGLVQNKPFDFDLTRSGLVPSVRLGVVCPAADARFLAGGLRDLNARLPVGRSDKDYLPEFPGFQSAFGLPIDLPEPGAAGWADCVLPSENLSPEKGAIELARAITQAVDALRASYAPHVVIVYVPTRINPFTEFEAEWEHFDLHDFVKAYCVQRGVATQFLREAKLQQADGARLWWWLSLAIYAKSMRTPWVLDSLEADTAFIGLGYSIDKGAPKGQHIVLGCSHIYNTRGEGLQYRLTKIEEPIVRNRNCFLGIDDARRVGETVRQLFFEAKGRLPTRVVIHKRTPFLKSERDGLRQGLAGVTEVDLLEINVDDALRYVASSVRGGRLHQDGYPVRRGTVVQIAPREALLWVHGATEVIQPGRRYYQGKRRIPAPLVLRRHAGISDLRQLSIEVLGLSKMDWNTFDLYKQLPATLESSSRIARIGALLERQGAAYDYRLFM
jgi:SIR2-like domain